MGMDISGKQPTAPAGEYFRNNVWWWRPLAEYILDHAPTDITDACEYWGSNDGDGLDAEGSKALAEFLREEIANGNCKEYADAHEAARLSLPRVPCEYCEGTGTRKDAVGIDAKMPEREIPQDANHPRSGQTGWCNGCDGWGTQEPFASHYPFSVDNVAEFATFLESCGGFEIW